MKHLPQIVVKIGWVLSIIISLIIGVSIKWYYGLIPIAIWIQYRLIAYAIYGYLMKKYERRFKAQMESSLLYMQTKAKQLAESVGKVIEDGKTEGDVLTGGPGKEKAYTS